MMYGILIRCGIVGILIFGDACVNSSNVLRLGFDQLTQTAWLSIAIGFALAPAVISSFPDNRARVIGLWACLGTFGMSCWSVTNFVQESSHGANALASSVERLQSDLALFDQQTKQALDICSRKPASVCDSIAKSDEYKAERLLLVEKLESAKLEKPVSDFERKFNISMLIALSFLLQVISAELGRQIGELMAMRKVPDKKVPEKSTAARNSEPKPEPKAGTAQKKTALESSKVASRKHKDIPTSEQLRRLKAGYETLIEKGEKITGENLRLIAGVRKGVALYWKKHHMPKVIKMEISK